MKTLITTLAFLGFTFIGFSQIDTQDRPMITIGVGYFGELFLQPGVLIFGEFALNEKESQLLLKTNFIYYRHRKQNRNWIFLPEVILRKNRTASYHVDLALGLGWLYQNPDGELLDFTNSDVFTITDKGWHYALPTIGLSLGKHFNMEQANQWTSSIGLRGMYQHNFRGVGLWHPALDVELGYLLK